MLVQSTNRIVVINPDGTKGTTFNSGSGFTAEANTVKIVSTGSGIWSTGGAMITQRFQLTGTGTQNEALAIGGCVTPLVYSCTEEYNGTSWTAGGALITVRQALAGAGTQNAGLAFGGADPGGLYCTEEYNGTSWSSGGASSAAAAC